MEPIQIVILLVFAVAILGALTWVSRHSSKLDRAYYSRRWAKIQKTSKDGNSGQKLAVIDADSLLDHAFKAMGLSGKGMGDRLKNAKDLLTNEYQDVWEAHKLRNRLVHEETKLKGSDARSALNTYRRALKKLGAL